MVERPPEPAILQPYEAARFFDYRPHASPPALARFVENFWTITWDLPSGQTYTAEVLPYPSVNLSLTNTESDVTGVVRTLYRRRLSGRGYAVGARFRPGCFRVFLAGPVSALTDRRRPISAVLGRDVEPTAARVATTENRSSRVALLADYLAFGRPPPDPTGEQLADLIDRVAADVSITRVAQLAGAAGTSVRTLQRAFTEYVGVPPKWVIQRCRMRDAAQRAAADEPIDWAELAGRLGFTDQAHFTRAFTATLGTSPAAYARRVSGGVSG